MELHNLSPAPGSTQEAKRKGRGSGSGNGKTACLLYTSPSPRDRG